MGSRVARVGDPDVDFDVTTTMKAVLWDESPERLELLIECEGGIGAMTPDSSNQIEDMDAFLSVSLAGSFNLAKPGVRLLVLQNARLIKNWAKEHAKVRIVAAPGRLTSIIGPDGTTAYFPRKDPA